MECILYLGTYGARATASHHASWSRRRRWPERLARLGVFTVQDLLFLLPLRYEDRTRVVLGSGTLHRGRACRGGSRSAAQRSRIPWPAPAAVTDRRWLRLSDPAFLPFQYNVQHRVAGSRSAVALFRRSASVAPLEGNPDRPSRVPPARWPRRARGGTDANLSRHRGGGAGGVCAGLPRRRSMRYDSRV